MGNIGSATIYLSDSCNTVDEHMVDYMASEFISNVQCGTGAARHEPDRSTLRSIIDATLVAWKRNSTKEHRTDSSTVG
jgi:hypothetical protein